MLKKMEILNAAIASYRIVAPTAALKNKHRLAIRICPHAPRKKWDLIYTHQTV